jgi:hypothetical protein
MRPLQLDWSTAEVSDGWLTVGFSDRAPKKWRDAFSRTAALLSGDTWEVGAVKPQSVRVAPVRPGEEERIKHFLESAVLEANTTLVSEDELFEPASAEPQADGEGVAAEEPPDQELPARFRAFA